MMTYNEAKAFIKPLNLKSAAEYFNWYNENREYAESIGLPENPEKEYSLEIQEENGYNEHVAEMERDRIKYEAEEAERNAERLARDEARYFYDDYKHEFYETHEEDEEPISFDEWYEEYKK